MNPPSAGATSTPVDEGSCRYWVMLTIHGMPNRSTS
jgi:hypothetical protein